MFFSSRPGKSALGLELEEAPGSCGSAGTGAASPGTNCSGSLAWFSCAVGGV